MASQGNHSKHSHAMGMKTEPTAKVSMLTSQMRLMLLWVVGGVILLLFAWLQILFGHYGDEGRDVIAWLLPLIIPTVSLVTGVWVNNVRKRSRSTKEVEKKTYQVVLAVSLFYLIFMALTFLIQPMVARPPLEVIKDSGLILSPLQGVVSVFLGIFFTQEPKK
jgi:hypothetical protein